MHIVLFTRLIRRSSVLRRRVVRVVLGIRPAMCVATSSIGRTCRLVVLTNGASVLRPSIWRRVSKPYLDWVRITLSRVARIRSGRLPLAWAMTLVTRTSASATRSPSWVTMTISDRCGTPGWAIQLGFWLASASLWLPTPFLSAKALGSFSRPLVDGAWVLPSLSLTTSVTSAERPSSKKPTSVINSAVTMSESGRRVTICCPAFGAATLRCVGAFWLSRRGPVGLVISNCNSTSREVIRSRFWCLLECRPVLQTDSCLHHRVS